MPKRPDKISLYTYSHIWRSSFSNKAKHEKDDTAMIFMSEDRSYRHHWTNPRTQSRHHRHNTHAFDNSLGTATYFKSVRSAKRHIKNKGLKLKDNYDWLNED